MEENHHDEKALNPKELKWKKDALELAKGLLHKYTNAEQDDAINGKLLDDAFEQAMKDSWWRRPKKFYIITALGYALGQYLVDNLSFEWIVYKDYQGKDIAVKHLSSGIICFPLSSVRKRMKTSEYRFMETYLNTIIEELQVGGITLPKLHYISQSKEGLTHLQAIESACQAGCKWLQLRMKNVSFQDYLNTAIAALKICKKYQAILTINDNPQVALESGADALHLGKQDMSPLDARKMLGDIIIGGTANTWEDILYLSKQQVDYIGLGPFRFTTTKDNLSPILGIKGYEELMSKMKAAGIDIPVLAIGGIELKDIDLILDAGVWGIAVSGLITKEKDKNALVANINAKLHT